MARQRYADRWPGVLLRSLMFIGFCNLSISAEPDRFKRLAELIPDTLAAREILDEFRFDLNRSIWRSSTDRNVSSAFSSDLVLGVALSRHDEAVRPGGVDSSFVSAQLCGSIFNRSTPGSLPPALLERRAALSFSGGGTRLRRIRTGRLPLAARCSGTLFASGGGEIRNSYDPTASDTVLNLMGIAALHETREDARLGLSLRPGFRLGRMHRQDPLVGALALEQRFLRTGGCAFPLSDRTILALTRLCAENRTSSLRSEKGLAAFKARIDSAMLADAAVQRVDLRYIPPMDLRRMMLAEQARLEQGLDLSLQVDAATALHVRHVDRRFDPVDDAELQNRQVGDFNAPWRLGLVCEGRASRPLNSHLWLGLSSRSDLLKWQTVEDTDSLRRRIVDASSSPGRFSGGASLMIVPGPALQLKLSLGRTPLFLALPTGLPASYAADLHFGFEDRLSAHLGIEYDIPDHIFVGELEEGRSAGLNARLSISRIF